MSRIDDNDKTSLVQPTQASGDWRVGPAFNYYAQRAAELIPGLDPTHPRTAHWVEVMILMEDSLKTRRKWSRIPDDIKAQLLASFHEVPLPPDRRDEYERRISKMKTPAQPRSRSTR
jgi:hypothetical protein